MDPAVLLLQYGALGALAVVLIPFLRRAYADQRDRADRLEVELREQNRLIRDRLMTDLTNAVDVIARQRRTSR